MSTSTYDPAGIDQQVVGTTAAQTLTNKTLTAPVLTAPALGTPASGVATNLTGTAAGLTAGNATNAVNATTATNATKQWLGIYSFDSGRPLTVSATNNSHSYNGGSYRPNTTGISDKAPGGSQIKLNGEYFNPAAFAQPASYTFGNASRHLADINSPYSWNLDAMVEKDTHISERYVATFRAEAFNSLNNVIFSGPTTSYASATFGTMATMSQSNTPRNIQISMRLTF